MMQIAFIVVFLLRVHSCVIYRPSDLPATEFSQSGEYNIGVILPVHQSSDTRICSSIINRFITLQKIEAVRFTINEINARSDLLPNTTLGFHMFDECYKDTVALTRALHFIQSSTHHAGTKQMKGFDVIGVIGSERSSNSIQIADLLSLFQVPVISYVSTSPVLSDKSTYPFFSRIVPSDTLQVSVLMDIIIKFNWNYVSIVYEGGSYGLEMYKAFRKLMTANSRCIAVARVIGVVLPDSTTEKVVNDLKSADSARAVILVVSTNNAIKIFSTVKRFGYDNYFTFLGTDSWGSNIDDYSGLENVAKGSLTIGFHGKYAQRLHTYIKYLTPVNGSDNPWFNKFYESYNKCEFKPVGNKTKCDNSMGFKGYKESMTTSFVMDAVYTYAYSLHAALKDCQSSDRKVCVKGEQFLQRIRNTSFDGEHGFVSFDKFGDGSATYVVRTIKEVDGKYELIDIGLWDTTLRSFLYLNIENITWKQNLGNSSHFPVSRCSEDCPDGFQAIVTSPACCWYCERCHSNEKSVPVDGKLSCETCPIFTWPNSSKTNCDSITIAKISYDNILGISFILMVFLISGGTTVCICLYSKYVSSSNNRELDYLILAGIFVSSLSSLPLIVPPSRVPCHLAHIGFHLSFTLVYCPFLVKAFNLHKLDKAGYTNADDGISSPLKKVASYFIGISLEIAIIIVSALLYPLKWDTIMPDINEAYVESACQMDEVGFLIPMCCNICILLITAWFVFLSRNVAPGICSVNECKFNNICVYTCLVIWLGFVVSYFTTSKLVIRSVILCILLLGNAAVFLCLLYISKLYDIFYPSEQSNNSGDRQTTLMTFK